MGENEGDVFFCKFDMSHHQVANKIARGSYRPLFQYSWYVRVNVIVGLGVRVNLSKLLGLNYNSKSNITLY